MYLRSKGEKFYSALSELWIALYLVGEQSIRSNMYIWYVRVGTLLCNASKLEIGTLFKWKWALFKRSMAA